NNLSAFGIFSASRIVPTRKSIFIKSSNVHISLAGSTFVVVSKFSCFVCSNLSNCFCMVLSSILANSYSLLLTSCSVVLNTSSSTTECQFNGLVSFSNCNISLSFLEVCGKKGSPNTASAVATCKATYIMVCVRSSSVFTVCQGSSSAKYLF